MRCRGDSWSWESKPFNSTRRKGDAAKACSASTCPRGVSRLCSSNRPSRSVKSSRGATRQDTIPYLRRLPQKCWTKRLRENLSRQDAKLAKKEVYFISSNLSAFASLRETQCFSDLLFIPKFQISLARFLRGRRYRGDEGIKKFPLWSAGTEYVLLYIVLKK